MKKNFAITIPFALVAMAAIAQQKETKKEKHSIGLGLKAGYNFAKVAGAASVNTGSINGFNVGAFYSTGSGKTRGRGFRTELIFSRQGYDFANANSTGNVQLDYVLLPQLATFNITKFVQIQLGGQVALLLNAKADSMVNNGQSNSFSKVADYYNKIDYGFAGGIEVHPVAGLMTGARLNISLANANKELMQGIPVPPFIAAAQDGNLKNNVLQIYAGWIF